MTSIKVLVVLLIIFYIAVLVQKNYSKSFQKPEKKVIVPTVSPTLTPFPTLIQTAMPTVLPTSISVPKTSNANIDSFIYPNSSRVSIEENSVVLQSSDDPQAITNWYKEKITGLGMNAKSFVQTNTNGNVLNKLIAANSDLKVSMTISKKKNQSSTEIIVNIN